ncbi:MAG: hypothetical protein ABI868_23020, partial [Acidobacteriota bacterium]
MRIRILNSQFLIPNFLPLPLLVLAFVLTTSACRGRDAASVQAEGTAAQPQSSTAAAPEPKTLNLTRANSDKPVVGTEVTATADGLPPDRTVDLVWETVEGGWVVEDGFRFRGKKFSETTRVLSRPTVGPDGRLSARFTVPEDYGGVHAVTIVDAGIPLAQGGIEVTQTFELHPSEGPIGTPIELRVTGFGWRTMDSTWVVNWDNQEVGYVSATDTRGSAVARFRATGPVGNHEIKVYTGYMGQSYLNHEQAPNAYLPRPGFTFRVTPGAVAAGGYVEPYQAQKMPAAEVEVAGAALRVTPAQGPVQTQAVLSGSGFAPNQPLALVWGTQVGSRVSGNGFAPKELELARLTTAADGRLDARLTIPEDLGGMHTLSIKSGEKTLARTFFAIETSIVSISPSSGPIGTPVSIHLKGVGWTDFDNIYIATYDNAYMGYACGFNSQGDVVVNFTAAGAPGVHLIDFYPGIYQGPEKDQQLYRLPMLTYADDHPGN